MIVTQAGRRRRKPAFRRRKNENRLGMSMAFLAIIMIIAVVGINSISLRQKQAKYIAREQELQQQIDAENAPRPRNMRKKLPKTNWDLYTITRLFLKKKINAGCIPYHKQVRMQFLSIKKDVRVHDYDKKVCIPCIYLIVRK